MDYSSFDLHCIQILEESPNTFSRHCFRSALKHIDLAERLIGKDNSMAAFRLYTAEEEAASGLIRILQELGYKRAKELNPKSHIHKNAFIPFFRIIRQFIEDSFRQYQIETELAINPSQSRNYISLVVNMALPSGPVVINPEPPFNFSFLTEGKRFSYRQQIDKFVQEKEAKNISSLLHAEANKRNLLLYASPKGVPSIPDLPPPVLVCLCKSSHGNA
jgi:hypothetical protein